MATNDKFLWAFSYAIGEECYTCPLYFQSQEHAEAQVFRMLSYASHIKFIDLRECKDGLLCDKQQLPCKQLSEKP